MRVEEFGEPRDYHHQARIARVGTALREASRAAAPVFGLVTDLFGPRPRLLAENVLLRQQLMVLRRQIRRPNLTAFDRAAVVIASAITSTWRESVLLVKPEMILRWHRQGFQVFWGWRTRVGAFLWRGSDIRDRGPAFLSTRSSSSAA